VGIPTQFRQRIFGVFETLGPPGRHGGTGIGLAIVQQAMQRMGGSVGVESNPGQGSSFWIELSEAEGRGALLSTPPSLQSAA
jgi:signal transduction histidine kinase